VQLLRRAAAASTRSELRTLRALVERGQEEEVVAGAERWQAHQQRRHLNRCLQARKPRALPPQLTRGISRSLGVQHSRDDFASRAQRFCWEAKLPEPVSLLLICRCLGQGHERQTIGVWWQTRSGCVRGARTRSL
jgi:hypothetical protein